VAQLLLKIAQVTLQDPTFTCKAIWARPIFTVFKPCKATWTFFFLKKIIETSFHIRAHKPKIQTILAQLKYFGLG
jgi:hypothetical protein